MFPYALPSRFQFTLNQDTLTYQTAHITAAALQIIMLVVSYATLGRFTGDLPARLATMPVAFLLARTGDPNFVHLSSENLPLVLLAGCAFAGTNALVRPSREYGWLFLAGSMAGAVAFAKLQAVPLALALTLMIAGGIWQGKGRPRYRLLGLASLTAGGLVVPTIVMGLVAAGGAWGEFWNLYIKANLEYGDTRASPDSLALRAISLICGSPLFTILCGMTTALGALAAACCVVNRRAGRSSRAWRGVAVSTLLVGVALFSVAKPGYHFPHYLMLLTLPCILLAGFSLATILNCWNPDSSNPGSSAFDGSDGRARRGLGRVRQPFVVMALVPVLAVPGIVTFRCLTAGSVFMEGRQPATYLAHPASRRPSRESGIIAEMTHSADQIAVWGWRPDIYIEAGRGPAVRDVESSVAIIPGPLREAARRRFLEDMRRHKPRLFVDGVCRAQHASSCADMFGEAIVDRRLGGHETFPELEEYIALNYVRRGEVRYPEGGVRIYERLP